MDPQVLRRAGVNPGNFRRAYVEDFALRIGQRATLVPSPGARAYGMLVSLTRAELDRLYGTPGLEDYRPETVSAHLPGDVSVKASCYNLEQAPDELDFDPDYARRLKAVLHKLEFPAEYVESIP